MTMPKDEKKEVNLAQTKSDDKSINDGKPAILMTGATHARELISTNLNVFQMLKLLRLGAVENDAKWKNLF